MKKQTVPQAIDLSRLKQIEVAWLIQKPTRWIRDNGHLFRRNPDSTYDGREVFSTMAKLLGKVVIEASEWERLQALAADPKNCEECVAGRYCDYHGNPDPKDVAAEEKRLLAMPEQEGTEWIRAKAEQRQC